MVSTLLNIEPSVQREVAVPVTWEILDPSELRFLVNPLCQQKNCSQLFRCRSICR